VILLSEMMCLLMFVHIELLFPICHPAMGVLAFEIQVKGSK